MAAQSRSKKTTVSNHLKTMRSVSVTLDPPITLNDQERFHFDAVVISRELDTWCPHDLTIAVHLSKALNRQEQISNRLDTEGLTIENQRGAMVAHPLLSASMTLASTIQALTRTLGLGASQRGISTPSQKDRNQTERKMRVVSNKADEDDLLE